MPVRFPVVSGKQFHFQQLHGNIHNESGRHRISTVPSAEVDIVPKIAS